MLWGKRFIDELYWTFKLLSFQTLQYSKTTILESLFIFVFRKWPATSYERWGRTWPKRRCGTTRCPPLEALRPTCSPVASARGRDAPTRRYGGVAVSPSDAMGYWATPSVVKSPQTTKGLFDLWYLIVLDSFMFYVVFFVLWIKRKMSRRLYCLQSVSCVHWWGLSLSNSDIRRSRPAALMSRWPPSSFATIAEADGRYVAHDGPAVASEVWRLC